MMTQTLFLDGEKRPTISQVARLLRQGELVAFPTDTVYGVGCDPWNAAAIAKLYAVKQRDQDKGIPILIADVADVNKVATHVSESALTLIRHFWPGPLSLILPRHPSLPEVISPNEFVAVRLPAHTVARNIIRKAGGAIATTSANRSGESPALNSKEAWDILAGQVAAVVDGYHAYHAAASTIVDCTTDSITIIRPGPVTLKELTEVLNIS